MPTTEPCRLCEAECDVAFTLRVLGHLDVAYLRCRRCGSLQTEKPYWLDEAYASGSVADRDTGVVMRNLDNQAAVIATLWSLGLPRTSRVLDFGGGTGLLCRLLRDQGVDARFHDPLASHELSPSFAVPSLDGNYDLISAFEVFEHLVEPGAVLRQLVEAGDSVLVGTEPYTGQGKDWWYLIPDVGQHVFFGSPAGFAWFAAREGLHHTDLGAHQLFTRHPVSRHREQILRMSLRTSPRRVIRALLAFRANYAAAQRDGGFDGMSDTAD